MKCSAVALILFTFHMNSMFYLNFFNCNTMMIWSLKSLRKRNAVKMFIFSVAGCPQVTNEMSFTIFHNCDLLFDLPQNLHSVETKLKEREWREKTSRFRETDISLECRLIKWGAYHKVHEK